MQAASVAKDGHFD